MSYVFSATLSESLSEEILFIKLDLNKLALHTFSYETLNLMEKVLILH